MTYRVDGPFVIITTTGKDTAGERQAVFSAMRSDPNVRNGALLIFDLRKYAVRLTQPELQHRVRVLLDTLGSKLGTAFAVIVADTSLRVGLGFQSVAGTTSFRVGVFNDEERARRWLTPYIR